MPDGSSQLEMLGYRVEPLSIELQEQIVRRCKSRHDAMRKCYEASGLTPQQLGARLALSEGQVSKILGGSKFLDPELYFNLFDVCGNEIPLRYDALHRGYELRPILNDAEAKIASLEKALSEERQLTRRLSDMLIGR